MPGRWAASAAALRGRRVEDPSWLPHVGVVAGAQPFQPLAVLVAHAGSLDGQERAEVVVSLLAPLGGPQGLGDQRGAAGMVLVDGLVQPLD